MRLSKEYAVEKVFDQYVLIPVGQAVVEYKQMIRLNETGYLIASMLLEDISYEEVWRRVISTFALEKEDYMEGEKMLRRFLEDMKNQRVLDV